MIYRYQEVNQLGTITVYLPTKEIPDQGMAIEIIKRAIDQTYEAELENDLPLMYDQGLIKEGEWEPPMLTRRLVEEMREDEDLRYDLAEQLLRGTYQGYWLGHMEKNPILLPEQDDLEEPEEEDATLTPINISKDEEQMYLEPTLQELLLERMPAPTW